MAAPIQPGDTHLLVNDRDEDMAALQDQFAMAQVQSLSLGYHAIRSGRSSRVPPAYVPS
jgi:hypothetical protein